MKQNALLKFKRTLIYVKPYRTFIFLSLLIMLADSLFHIYFAYVQQQLVDAMNAGGESMSTLIMLTLLLVVVIGTMRYAGGYIDRYYRTLVTKDLSSDVFRKLTRLPFRILQKHKPSDLVARATGDAGSTANLVGGFLHQLLANVLLCLFAFIYLLYVNAVLAFAALLTGPLLFLIGRFFDRRVRAISANVQKLSADLRGTVQEMVRGMMAIRSFQAESFFRKRFERKKQEWNREVYRLRMTQTWMMLTVELVMNAVIIACTFLICWFVISGYHSLGAIIAFIFLMVKVQIPFIELSGAWNSMQEGLAAADRVYQVLDVPEVRQGLMTATTAELSATKEGGGSRHRSDAAVEWRGVTCHEMRIDLSTKNVFVRTERRLLDNIHLAVQKGERVAITGPSGAGKTTLLRICSGLMEYDTGQCFVEGRLVHGTDVHLPCSISYVPQTPYLFPDMTIRENIAIGLNDVSEEDVVQSAKLAQAHDFILELEQQYDTKIGELEVGLSGGERQRIAIARALIRRTPVLVLDEATSSLDRVTGRKLIDAVSGDLQLRGGTLLIVTHQLEMVQEMDRIVFMKDGKIERVGTHLELMDTCADYRQMIERFASHAS